MACSEGSCRLPLSLLFLAFLSVIIVILHTNFTYSSSNSENSNYYSAYHSGYIEGLRTGYSEGYSLKCFEKKPEIKNSVQYEGVIVRKFDIGNYTLHTRISTRRYLYYKFLARPSNLSEYITPEESEIKELALTLREQMPEDSKFAQAVLELVHQLDYEQDITAFNTKFPLETLAEGSGDCEDLSLLAVSLLRAGGLKACLVDFGNHTGCAVALNRGKGYYFAWKGEKYFYMETSKGWKIGELPGQLQKPAKLIF